MDPELQAIRDQRMAQLSQQYGGDMQSAEQQQQQQEHMKKQEEMKNMMLSQILDQPARARLNTISLTKPEKAQAVEKMLIQMAQSGQIPGKLGESQLIGLLEKVSQQTQKATKVKFDRRRAALDSDDDDF